MSERLTTLTAVKDYLGIPEDNTDSDRFLTRLIDAASQFVLNWVDRDSFGVRSFTQNFNSNRQSALLVNWPVESVTSVGTGGSFVPASVQGNAGLYGSGYYTSDKRFGPQTIQLNGYGFMGPSQVIYTAGFRTFEEAVIPTDDPWQITPDNDGRWIANIQTTIDGVIAARVDETPGPGEYSIDGWGVYTFNTADGGKTAKITYDYAPFDVSFAVDELIGEWYKRKDRIGVLSRTLGGQETITFSQKDMSDAIKAVLQPYCNVVPM